MTAPGAPDAIPAPLPPGRLGEASDAVALLDYQIALQRWLLDRRSELDQLYGAASRAGAASSSASGAPGAGFESPGNPAGGSAAAGSVVSDVVLALTMWESVRSRAEELRALWDSGRAGTVERERMSRVIWARLESAPVPGTETAVSLAEATTLVDALVRQIRSRLAFGPDSPDVAARLRAVRASLVRSADLLPGSAGAHPGSAGAAAQPARALAAPEEPGAGGDPAAPARSGDTAQPPADGSGGAGSLRARMVAAEAGLARLMGQAARGGDVSGPLAELEASAARLERDTLVAAARRHGAELDAARAREMLARLRERQRSLTALAARARAQIADPPRLAVPDVERLGALPLEPDAVATYLTRLEQVERAFDQVEDAYSEPLAARDGLRLALQAARTRADATGRIASPTVRSALQEASEALDAVPCRLPLARDLVGILDHLSHPLPHTLRAETGTGA